MIEDNKDSKDIPILGEGMEKIYIQCGTCGERLNRVGDELMTCFPCEHIVHKECKGVQYDNISRCGICLQKITSFLTKDQLDENSQCYKDIESINKKREIFSLYRVIVGICRFIRILCLLFCLWLRDCIDFILCGYTKLVNLEYLLYIDRSIINILNIHVHLLNQENFLNDKTKRIVICNHTNYCDMLVMATVDQIPFVASPEINKYYLGRKITENYPHLIVENEMTCKSRKPLFGGEKTDEEKGNLTNFDRITQFMNSKNHIKLMICPEGTFSHTDYLIEFRSTAFNIKIDDTDQMFPVEPVIMKYDRNIYNLTIYQFLFLEELNVYIYCLNTVKYENFENPLSFQKFVREKISHHCDLKLSRVENRSYLKKKGRKI